MKTTTKGIRYPKNLEVKVEVYRSGVTLTDLAKAIGVSREALSTTLNGHKKGVNIIPAIKKELGIK